MSCNGFCKKFQNNTGKINYNEGDKWCPTCDTGFIKEDNVWCLCCHARLRGKSRNSNIITVKARMERNRVPTYKELGLEWPSMVLRIHEKKHIRNG